MSNGLGDWGVDAGEAGTSERVQTTLVLMGLRASGKSSVGRLLASRLGRRFVDLDDLTPSFVSRRGGGEPGRARLSAADVLREFGEPEFRAAESRALRTVLSDPGIVLALGGGTPTAPGARALLVEHAHAGACTLIYLRCDPAVLEARLQRTDLTHRPSLTGRGVVGEVRILFDQRDPLYRGIANDVMEAGTADPDRIARILAHRYG